jgi:hypothetical protein
LKRKSFQPGNYYVVNQKNLGGQTYNVVQTFKKDISDAKDYYDKVDTGKFSKILVDGTSGKIKEQQGPANLVGQNLIYMYEHIQGKVYDGRFTPE